MYHLLILNVIMESCVSNMYICSLIVVNSFFVLYLMCCFGNNPFVYGFQTNKHFVLFCSVLFCSVLSNKPVNYHLDVITVPQNIP